MENNATVKEEVKLTDMGTNALLFEYNQRRAALLAKYTPEETDKLNDAIQNFDEIAEVLVSRLIGFSYIRTSGRNFYDERYNRETED